MRKNIVAGNWKMNKNLQEGIALAKELNEAFDSRQTKLRCNHLYSFHSLGFCNSSGGQLYHWCRC